MNQPTLLSPLVPSNFKPVKFDQLPWEEQATLMWSWYWRTLIIGLLTIWLGGVVGGFIGTYITIAFGKLDSSVLVAVGYIVGGAIGFLGTNPVIKLVTQGKMGEYQLVIFQRQTSETSEGAR